jgi:hypothetical protein
MSHVPFWGGKFPNSGKKTFFKVMPTFDSSFDFVTFFIIFKKFIWIALGTYCHLLLNSS